MEREEDRPRPVRRVVRRQVERVGLVGAVGTLDAGDDDSAADVGRLPADRDGESPSATAVNRGDFIQVGKRVDLLRLPEIAVAHGNLT
jgi:hypothetical protein